MYTCLSDCTNLSLLSLIWVIIVACWTPTHSCDHHYCNTNSINEYKQPQRSQQKQEQTKRHERITENYKREKIQLLSSNRNITKKLKSLTSGKRMKKLYKKRQQQSHQPPATITKGNKLHSCNSATEEKMQVILKCCKVFANTFHTIACFYGLRVCLLLCCSAAVGVFVFIASSTLSLHLQHWTRRVVEMGVSSLLLLMARCCG